MDDDAIERHRTLVKMAANRHWSRIKGRTWLGVDDLEQAGLIALVGGLARFDPEAGNENSYLWKTVYLGIQKEISTHSGAFYISSLFLRCVNKIRQDEQRDATEWAKRLDVSVEYAREVIAYIGTVCQSLDAPHDVHGKDKFTLHELIANPPDESEAEEEAWEKLFERLCKTEFEKTVLKLTYEGQTQSEIAEVTSMSEHSVYRAFRRIRERHLGGKANDQQTQIPRTKKKSGPRPGDIRQRLTGG